VRVRDFASKGAEPRSEWLWLGGGAGDPRSDSTPRRKARILAALHVGHGLGTAFDICAESGPTSRLTLGCSSPDAARWAARVLVPAYGRSAWTRLPPVFRPSGFEREWGKRVRPWPDRLREIDEGPSGTDLLALALTGVSPGVRISWRFSPHPASWSRPPATDGGEARRPVPLPGVARPRATGVLSLPRQPAVQTAPVFWKARVALELPTAVARSGEARGRTRSAVEGALRSGGANGVRFHRRRLLRSQEGPWFEVAENELAAILPDVEGGSAVPPAGGVPGCVLPLGRADGGWVVGPLVEPTQGRHLAVLGETGMGKSATLVALALKAKELGGVILFDPLGETVSSFVRELTAQERRDRLVWVSPREGSARINALEGTARREGDAVRADRRLNDLVHALRRVRSGRYESSFWGPRLEEMLTRALAATATIPSSTLADAHTLLATGGRIRQVVPPEAHDAVRELADRVRERPDDAEGARRLLFEVVRSPVLSRMLCDRDPPLHTAELVAPDRIVVISGDAAVVGESAARYLLAVYLALVWSELLARPHPSKTFVLLDESQWFAHESLAEMLRLARRQNVHVILATQTIGSLPDGVDQAVWANVSDFLAFRGSPEEARELSRATSRLSVEELLSLPRGHAAVLLGKGNSVAWVRAVGRPAGPTEPSSIDPASGGARFLGGGRSARANTSTPTTVEEVLRWIRARARSDTVDGELRVSLPELRDSVDPEGTAVRAAGALLGRTGALLSSVREGPTPTWILDPNRLPPPPTEGDESLPQRATDGPRSP